MYVYNYSECSGKCLAHPPITGEGGKKHAQSFKPETQWQGGVGELEGWEGWNGVKLGLINVRAKCTPILILPEALHCEAHQHHETEMDDSWAQEEHHIENEEIKSQVEGLNFKPTWYGI